MIGPTSTSKATAMPKALTVSAMVVAALLLLIFGLDAIIGIPFGKASLAMDIGAILGAGIMGYLGWSAYRELK